MTTIPQNECCLILGIHPKTLRDWLRHANMQFAAHPTDARLKCLTQTQIQQLADLHNRPLSSFLTTSPAQEHEALKEAASASLPAIDLSQSLVRLQAQVATMQEQLTQLALELLHERQQHTERRLSTLEALLTPAGERPSSPLPGAARGHWGVLPLIASTATGSYVIICPTEGELSFLPDSPEWLAWLATLSSFRFMGQQGRFSTYRNKGRSYWTAYRRIHGHRYEYTLGYTEHLTIDRLEQMAATLQSHAPSL